MKNYNSFKFIVHRFNHRSLFFSIMINLILSRYFTSNFAKKIFMCKIWGVLIISLFLLSCSPARFVQPLEKKQQAFDLSLGGPLFKYEDITIPMPFLSATYGYGIDSTLTGFGSINITSALYGNFQIELGVTKQFVKQNKYTPGISVIPVCNIIYRNKDAAKFYPQFDIYSFWEYGKKHNLIYFGVSNWFELAKSRSLDQEQQNHWFFTPVAGHSFVGAKWNFNVEAKVIAPFLSNEKLVVEYQTPFNSNGAFGVYIGCTRKF